MSPLFPIAVPSSSPRPVSIMGVNGWYSANQRSQVGIDRTGVGSEADAHGDHGDHGQAEHGLEHAAESVAATAGRAGMDDVSRAARYGPSEIRSI